MAGSSLMLTPDAYSGRKLGKYEVLCRLSTGGMSEIFLAFQRGLAGFRKFVVLKQILPDIKGEEEFVRMFLDEARITAAFMHPNIAQVFDLDIDDGELFLAMEFVPGATLVEVARACRQNNEPIPIGFTLMAVRDTALALHYAHTFTDPAGRPQQVIHRDIAEKNIMVTYEGVTKLLDFGIAKDLNRLVSRTSVGMVKGTSGYMSPEQILGEKLDPRSDIFSLGVVLHECLTGMRLFHGKTAEEGMMQALKGEITPPSRQNPGVSAELDAVVLKALQRNRDDRYATALELARAVEKVADGSLWHAEQSGELLQRLFGQRRDQTRQMMSQAQGTENTGEFQLAKLMGNPNPPTPIPAPAAEITNTDSPQGNARRSMTSAGTVPTPPAANVAAVPEDEVRAVQPLTERPKRKGRDFEQTHPGALLLTPVTADVRRGGRSSGVTAVAAPDVNDDDEGMTIPAGSLAELLGNEPLFGTNPGLKREEKTRPDRGAAPGFQEDELTANIHGDLEPEAKTKQVVLEEHAITSTTPSDDRRSWLTPVICLMLVTAATLAWSMDLHLAAFEMLGIADADDSAIEADAPVAPNRPAPEIVVRPTTPVVTPTVEPVKQTPVRAPKDPVAVPTPEKKPETQPAGAESEPQLVKKIVPAIITPERKPEVTAAAVEKKAPPTPEKSRTPIRRRLVRQTSRATSAPAQADASPGVLTLVTEPYSTVFLGNRELGVTPLFKLEVPSGKHTLKLVGEDNKPVSLTVEINGGKETKVRVPLSTLRPF